MTTPPEAAPMREDVTQVTDADREAALAVLGGIWSDDEKAVIRQGNRDSLSIIQAFARHRLAHTARPDAPNLNSYIDGYEDAQEVAARPDAGDEVERVVHTSNYAIQVLDERYASGPAPGQIGSFAEHDAGLWQAGKFLLERLRDHEVRMTCDEDAREWYGHVTPAVERFRAALAAMREGVDRGMVEVPRVLPVFVCDVMTEVKVSDGRGGFTALNWEEAEQVWDAALAALSRKGGRGG